MFYYLCSLFLCSVPTHCYCQYYCIVDVLLLVLHNVHFVIIVLLHRIWECIVLLVMSKFPPPGEAFGVVATTGHHRLTQPTITLEYKEGRNQAIQTDKHFVRVRFSLFPETIKTTAVTNQTFNKTLGRHSRYLDFTKNTIFFFSPDIVYVLPRAETTIHTSLSPEYGAVLVPPATKDRVASSRRVFFVLFETACPVVSRRNRCVTVLSFVLPPWPLYNRCGRCVTFLPFM